MAATVGLAPGPRDGNFYDGKVLCTILVWSTRLGSTKREHAGEERSSFPAR